MKNTYLQTIQLHSADWEECPKQIASAAQDLVWVWIPVQFVSREQFVQGPVIQSVQPPSVKEEFYASAESILLCELFQVEENEKMHCAVNH